MYVDQVADCLVLPRARSTWCYEENIHTLYDERNGDVVIVFITGTYLIRGTGSSYEYEHTRP